MAKVVMWDRDIVDFVNVYSSDKALKKVLNNKLEKNVPLGVVYEDLKVWGGEMTFKQAEKVEKLLKKYYNTWRA